MENDILFLVVASYYEETYDYGVYNKSEKKVIKNKIVDNYDEAFKIAIYYNDTYNEETVVKLYKINLEKNTMELIFANNE